VQALQGFDIGFPASITERAYRSMEELWEIFKDLSYHGRARNGLAGVVGISKAVLLLTEGRVGPAFDANVRNNLGIREPPANPREWIRAIEIASRDIQQFRTRHDGCSLQQAVPEFADLHSGRIYDMALGPRAKSR
jgi:hypothetical protein